MPSKHEVPGSSPGGRAIFLPRSQADYHVSKFDALAVGGMPDINHRDYDAVSSITARQQFSKSKKGVTHRVTNKLWL